MKEKYHSLISEMFKHYQGWGEDAALRTSVKYRKDAATSLGIVWNESWDKRFTGEDNRNAIKTAYQAFTAQLADDLNIPKLTASNK